MPPLLASRMPFSNSAEMSSVSLSEARMVMVRRHLSLAGAWYECLSRNSSTFLGTPGGRETAWTAVVAAAATRAKTWEKRILRGLREDRGADYEEDGLLRSSRLGETGPVEEEEGWRRLFMLIPPGHVTIVMGSRVNTPRGAPWTSIFPDGGRGS